jgi:predicted AlkP superfamily phosphohydrolase/phosphomutase
VRRYLFVVGLVSCEIAFLSVEAEGYVGPGPGFALALSFVGLLASLLLLVAALLTWPLRSLVFHIRRRTLGGLAQAQRVVVVGFDGLDAEKTEQFMAEGLLPSLSTLRDKGMYARLRTTLPAESPVAWASFQTGCNPGRHRVFDFVVPNLLTYAPELCSARVAPPRRHLHLGSFRIPLGRARLSLELKAQPFWIHLGQKGIFSTIIRVPITFPPERFNGLLLSGMLVPDLLGTQGTFTFYCSAEGTRDIRNGRTVKIPVGEDGFSAEISGPQNPLRRDRSELRIPFKVIFDTGGSKGTLLISGARYPLIIGKFTPWIPLTFRTGFGVRIRAMCQFVATELAPHVKLYMTPLQIDPAHAVLPISHPRSYAPYLAKVLGRFATLGMAEDTSALDAGVISEQAFLDQAYAIHAERERMLFDAIAKTETGLVVCVFDITDRVQHMFWRQTDTGSTGAEDLGRSSAGVIPQLYQRVDELVGKIMEAAGPGTSVLIMSDHGCKSFDRAVNLNAWLREQGYLVLHDGADGEDLFRGVDWQKTQAYAVGMGGIYLNRKGREASGIVEAWAIPDVKRAISAALLRLFDMSRHDYPIKAVYDTRRAYHGPYVGDGPDLVVGFSPGYRASWRGATGTVGEPVLIDNDRAWSGDHCINPSDVPGVLFSNRSDLERDAHITDLAPTLLDLFGIPAASYNCDGRSLLRRSTR